MRNSFKRFLKIMLFILIFAVLMNVLNFCFVVPNAASYKAWKAYAESGDIDTLFVGSSVGRVADTEIIDSMLGCKSINMSTPDQLYKTHYDAIDFILRQKPVKRVIMIMELDSIKNDEHYIADYSFRSAMYMNASPKSRLRNEIKEKKERYLEKGFCGSTDSVNIWFNWVKCPLKSWETIKNNTIEGIEDIRLDKSNCYIDVDSRMYERKAEPTDDNALAEVERDIERLSALNIKCFETDDEAVKIFDCILRYLKINDIETAVIIAPCRLDERDKYGDDYDNIDNFMRCFTEKRGAVYMNLDTDKEVRSALEKSDDFFKDSEHLNDYGIKTVAPIMGNRLKTIYFENKNRVKE